MQLCISTVNIILKIALKVKMNTVFIYLQSLMCVCYRTQMQIIPMFIIVKLKTWIM